LRRFSKQESWEISQKGLKHQRGPQLGVAVPANLSSRGTQRRSAQRIASQQRGVTAITFAAAKQWRRHDRVILTG
jgi:hypothetical protein